MIDAFLSVLAQLNIKGGLALIAAVLAALLLLRRIASARADGSSLD